ncbi:hypothetical protein H9P43_006561 [Blastocladiella emersonii ATCC 22665]|nr:hypothetical protein H9P43_006561 [Blastocladiella emersonii ATCC 22665]
MSERPTATRSRPRQAAPSAPRPRDAIDAPDSAAPEHGLTPATQPGPSTAPASPRPVTATTTALASPVSSLSSVASPPPDLPPVPWTSRQFELRQPQPETAVPNAVPVDETNFTILIRVAVLRHLRLLRARDGDADRAYRDASFPVLRVAGNQRILSSAGDRNRACRLLSDAVLALAHDPAARILLCTTRVDRPSLLTLRRMTPGKQVAKLAGVRDLRSAGLAAALDRKLAEYVDACANVDGPSQFRIPAENALFSSPRAIQHVFAYCPDLKVLRVAPAVLDEADGDVMGNLLRVHVPRKRDRDEAGARSEDEGGDGDDGPSPARQVRRKVDADPPRVVQRLPPSPTPTRPPLSSPTRPAVTSVSRVGQSIADSRGDPRALPNESMAAQVPLQSRAIDDANAALEFSADVFEALGTQSARLSAGEFEKRVQIAFRRGWTVSRTVEWLGGT